MSEEEEKPGHTQIINDGSAVDESFSKIDEVFLDGNILEERSRLKPFAGVIGDKTEEKENNEKSDGDDAWDNLARCQGGSKTADCEEEGTHEEEYGVGSYNLSCFDGWGWSRNQGKDF